MVNFGKSYINSLNADQSKCIIKRKGNCTLTTAAPKDWDDELSYVDGFKLDVYALGCMLSLIFKKRIQPEILSTFKRWNMTPTIWIAW